MKYLENELYCEDLANTINHVINFDFFHNKRVMVLGATGLIGSFIVDCFMYANQMMHLDIVVCAVGRNRQGFEKRFGKNPDRQLEFVEADINQGLVYTGETDVIIHSAGHAYPKAFRTEPVETLLNGVVGTYNVLKTARQNKDCRVLFVSSGEVYGNSVKAAPVKEDEYSYVDILSPRSCYPNGKRAGETLCVSYLEEYGVDTVIARPCHTFGPNVTANDNRATAQFIEAAVQDKDIVLKSSGMQERSFAYIADCASGLLTVITSGVSGNAYNIATNEVMTIRKFAEICASESQGELLVDQTDVTAKAEASPISRQVLDNESLKRLGWSSCYTIHQGIQHSVAIQKSMNK